MVMTITNIAWHSDLIREFLFDLEHPKLKAVGFNDIWLITESREEL